METGLFLFKFEEDIAEIGDAIFLVEENTFLFIELHPNRTVFVVDPDMTVGIDDAMKGDSFFTIIPGFREDPGDTLRCHVATACGSRNPAICCHSSGRYRECEFHHTLTKGLHKLGLLDVFGTRDVSSLLF